MKMIMERKLFDEFDSAFDEMEEEKIRIELLNKDNFEMSIVGISGYQIAGAHIDRQTNR